MFSFLDKEYLTFYRRKFLVDLPLVWGGFLILWYFFPTLAFILFLLYTEYHVVSQQGGIALAFMKVRPRLYQLWRVLIIGMFSLLYLILFKESSTLYLSIQTLIAVSGIVTVLFVLVSWHFYAASLTKEGSQYIVAASIAVVVSFVLFFFGYPLLAIFLQRFVHDVTAFIFYIVHDYNRSLVSRTNALYLLFSPLLIPLYVLTPVVAVGIAFLISHTFVTIALLLVFVTHYYVESFMWKRGSLHRSYVSFQ